MNVFIVEDEKTALERIVSFGLWNEDGYSICGTAGNGEEALRLIGDLDPDVIITDIEMPVMNGIEMIRELKAERPGLPVIILSCHESFEYAKAAVSLGVREYLLKDFMEEDAVRAALAKASSVSAGRISPVRLPSGGERADERAFLSAILKGGRPSALFDGGIREGRLEEFSLLLVHIDGFSAGSYDPRVFMEELYYELDTLPPVCKAAAYEDAGNFWLLIPEAAPVFAGNFFGRMEGRRTSVTIAAGEPFGPDADLKAQAARVRELFGYRLFLGKNRIILPETVSSIGGKNPEVIRKKIRLLQSAVIEGDSGSCFRLLRELYDRDLPGMLRYNYLEWVNLRLLAIILAAEEKGEINIRELTGMDYLPVRELELKETVSEMRQWFEDIFSRIFRLESEDPMSGVSNRNVLKVIRIIKDRYDEDLSLEGIAGEIGVHKVYLSRLFRQETGRTLYDYLQSYRVGKAEGLLKDESLKMYEVASRSGFKNYDQFAVVFKKTNGTSPSEFRKNLFR